MTIKLTFPYHQFKVGDVVDSLPEGVMRTLIQRRRAEEVKAVEAPKRNKMLAGARNK